MRTQSPLNSAHSGLEAWDRVINDSAYIRTPAAHRNPSLC